jgi:hypothetical protein
MPEFPFGQTSEIFPKCRFPVSVKTETMITKIRPVFGKHPADSPRIENRSIAILRLMEAK